MTQPDDEWAGRLVRVIVGELKRYRQERGLSAQQVSEASAKLGHEIPRSVLANLESGRRETISVPELLVLAEVLGVPPVQLVLPLGTADTVELLPDKDIAVGVALGWLTGERPLPDGAKWRDFNLVELYRAHQFLADHWRDATVAADDGMVAIEIANNVRNQLRGVRAAIRAKDLRPPPLPPTLAHLDDEGAGE